MSSSVATTDETSCVETIEEGVAPAAFQQQQQQQLLQQHTTQSTSTHPLQTLNHLHTSTHVQNDGEIVEKTVYDAADFLNAFNTLRQETETLKHNNITLQLQLHKVRQDLNDVTHAKESLETQVLQERESTKELLWKLREDFQKVQEQRLQWKEKYLEVCTQTNSIPSTLVDNTLTSSNTSSSSSTSTSFISTETFYSNLTTAFGVTQQAQQLSAVSRPTNQLWNPDIKRFTCKHCQATFKRFTALQSHIDQKKCKEYTYRCPECSVVFSKASSFSAHLKHHLSKSVQCQQCGDKFTNHNGLKRHTKMYHTQPTQTFQCQYCNKVFARKCLLTTHIRRHFDQRPYKCPHCTKSFKTRQYLTGHVNGVHKTDKQFVCEKCGARFSWRTTWKRHLLTHMNNSEKKKKKSNSNSRERVAALDSELVEDNVTISVSNGGGGEVDMVVGQHTEIDGLRV